MGGQIIVSGGGNGGASVETGNWTPAISFTTPGDLSVAYTHQTGRYIRIGRLVILQYDLLTSSFTYSTASGIFIMTGLPFTVGVAALDQSGGSLTWRGFTLDTAQKDVHTLVNGFDRFQFRISGSGVSVDSIQAGTEVPSGGTLALAGTQIYETDDA